MNAGPRKVRLSDVRRPDITLVVLDGAGAEVEYTVRGQLTVEEVIAIMQLQKQLTFAGGEADPVEVMEAVQESSKLVTKLVHERYPDADPLNLGMEEVTMGFAAMMGGVSAADEFAMTLTEGLSDEFVASSPEVPDDVDPTTVSPTPSSPPSEDSQNGTAGILTGGEHAAGDLSSSPSTEPMSV